MSGANTDNIEALIDKWIDESVPVIDGEASEAAPAQQAEGDQQAQPSEQAPQQEAQPTGEQPKPDGEQKPTGDKAQQPDKQQQRANPGDLVDAQGRVIAKAGAERRHYETAQRVQRELGTARQELTRVQTELKAFREAAVLPQQLGLSPEESASGLQLAASWKQNPVGVINYLIEQAKAAGHNVDGLGGPQTDMAAIRAMIANELAPIRSQTQAQVEAQQRQTQAQQQVENLRTEYGDAALVNSEALAKVIDAAQQQGRSMNLEQAYLRFTAWCYQHGLDPHQPIDPQMAQRAQPEQQTPQPATQQRMPPRPNGRAASMNGAAPLDPTAQFTGNESSRDIIRAAMREAGLNV
jgi:hypothetical protein